jgi:hypothetical protein
MTGPLPPTAPCRTYTVKGKSFTYHYGDCDACRERLARGLAGLSDRAPRHWGREAFELVLVVAAGFVGLAVALFLLASLVAGIRAEWALLFGG